MKQVGLFILCLSLTASSAFAATYQVDTEKSSVGWVGTKLAGQHNGTIQIQSGEIEFDGDKWVGGKAVIDMTSIQVEDLKNPGANKSLRDHLKNSDFFDVKKHKTATLVIEEVKSKGPGLYDAVGAFTIKGITRKISFEVSLDQEDGLIFAQADIKIDRTLFDIRYGSGKFFQGLGDRLIHDDFRLSVSAIAQK